MSRGRVGPWRRSLQWTAALCVLLLPFGRIGGESLLRLDLSRRCLLLLGRAHPLEEMHLVLPLVAALILSFLLVTMTLGRVWCGWACPQTTLADLTDAWARWVGARTQPGRAVAASRGQAALLHVGYVAVGLLVGANLVWYFVSPYEFFPRLLQGALPAGASGAMAVVALAVYVHLAFVRRSFCRTVCPYGRFQAALADSATLAVALRPEDAHRCLQCGACARACPTGVDIRGGQPIECLQCGRCVDACREVMGRRHEAGLVGFAFEGGTGGRRALLNPRTILVLLAAVAAAGAFGASLARWAPASLSLRRTAAPERILASGGTAVFFDATLLSRSAEEQVLSLEVRTPTGEILELRGEAAALKLGPRERRVLRVALILPEGRRPEAALFALRDRRERVVAEVRAPLGPEPRP